MRPVSPQIGRARPDELSTVAALMMDTYVGGGFVAADSPYVAELCAVRERWEQSDLLVARVEGEVVGTVTFCLPGTPWAEVSVPGEAEFRMLAVRDHARRAGIGRGLVRECLDRATAAGAHTVVISTTPRMRTAHRMYESMGFRRRPERDWRPRPEVPLWVYAWTTDP